MCGFLGIYAPAKLPVDPEELSGFRASAQRVSHRGNTGQGEKISRDSALFHYRLAFRDLADGKQPLTDSEGRATIIFNGELYGYQALRQELSTQYKFSTRSDTEVILAAYLVFGNEFLARLDGEYAFVIHDHRDGSILAARDPYGVKPIFWGASKKLNGDDLRFYKKNYSLQAEGRLHFASEMKGLALPLQWDRRGLERQFLSLYEEMATPFSGVFALAPGALLLAKHTPEGWSLQLERKIAKHVAKPSSEDFSERALELKKLVAESVRMKLDSEVPLGAYLSGGIDSRIVAHEMGKLGDKIETFTVGFSGSDYDESQDVAEFLAKYPNLEGRVLRTDDQALSYSYSHAIYASELVQPYTNGGAKWWLSRFARRYVRGVLTGDGSDELFCGYPSYRYLAWWKFFQRHPSEARLDIYAARVVGKKEKFWEKGISSGSDGGDLLAASSALGWPHPLYAQIESVGQHLLGKNFQKRLLEERDAIASYLPTSGSALGAWRDYFMHTHFPTHVLNWVGDRMEMANTLEGRPIYLTRALLDFARHSPDAHLVRGLRDKAILRKAYAKDLGNFAQAPKKQFNAPFLAAGEFLEASNLKESGLFDPALIQRVQVVKNNTKDPLERSFADIFLQNCLVTQMLDRYLVRGQAPERDLNYEEKFLDQRTEKICRS
jgi:asparagine synthase (glutamine-hydrolysing)